METTKFLIIFIPFLWLFSLYSLLTRFPSKKEVIKKYPFKKNRWSFMAPSASGNDYRQFYDLYKLDTSHPKYKDFNEDEFDDLIRRRFRVRSFSWYISLYLFFLCICLNIPYEDGIKMFLLITPVTIVYLWLVSNYTKKRLEH